VWGILAGSAVGLLAATLGRLYSSTFYALNDTRTPLRFAIVRVAVGVALGAAGAFLLPPALGLDRAWGAAGLTLGSALAGWLEYALLRRALHARVGVATMGTGYALRLWAAALVAAAAGWGVRLAVGERSGVLVEVAILTAFGIAYLAMASILVAESRAFVGGLSRRLGLSRRR
jgi:putative peptidoglycan lipid II flippase